MTVRIIKTIAHPYATGTFVRIVKDRDSGEIIARLYIRAKRYEPADYYTDNVQDATGTALEMLATVHDTAGL